MPLFDGAALFSNPPRGVRVGVPFAGSAGIGVISGFLFNAGYYAAGGLSAGASLLCCCLGYYCCKREEKRVEEGYYDSLTYFNTLDSSQNIPLADEEKRVKPYEITSPR